jgi:hypothetical protein
MKRFVPILLAMIALGGNQQLQAGTVYTVNSTFNTGITSSKLHQLWQETYSEYNTSKGSISMPSPAPILNSASLTAASLTAEPVGSKAQVALITGTADTVISAGNPSPAFLLQNKNPTLTIGGNSGNLIGVHAISLNFGFTDPNGNPAPTGTWTVTLSDLSTVTQAYAVQSSGSDATDFFGYIASGNLTITSVSFASSDVSGNNTQYVVLDNITAYTPEPASMTLLAIGGLGMAGYGWRRRKQAATA